MSISPRVLSLALAGIILMPVASAAQSPVTIGVKGGVNMAKLKFNDSRDDDVKSLLGAVGGLFLSKSINDTLGVRLEGLFSQKGFKNQEIGLSDDPKFTVTSVDVPLLLTLGPSSSSDTRFNVFTGPQVSFNTKAEEDFLGVKTDRGDDVKGTDFSWVLGAGIEKGRITADARYAFGLTSLAEDSTENIKNRVFSVMIGVKLK